MITIPLLLAALASFEPSPIDLLETELLLEWSELPFMAADDSRILIDGHPRMLLPGGVPLPAWGSFESVSVRSPLEAGVWGGGGWTMEFAVPEIPDSSYRSMAGLMESTVGRNRYAGLLQRPLPMGLGFGAALGREDTLSTQLLSLVRKPFSLDGFLWQGSGIPDGYAARASFAPGRPDLEVSCGIVSPSGGVTYAEPSLSAAFGSGSLRMEAAAGASAWDSIAHVEAHLKASAGFGGTILVARGDLSGDPDDAEAVGMAGVLQTIPSGPVLGVALTGAGESGGGLLATASWGPVGAEAYYRDGAFTSGIHLRWPSWLSASAFRSDSLLRAAMTVFPGFAYGRNGRINIGGRMTATRTGEDDPTEEIRADFCTAFSLGGFSLVGAVEDIFDDGDRRIAYGIVWRFSDPPAWRPADPGEERGR